MCKQKNSFIDKGSALLLTGETDRLYFTRVTLAEGIVVVTEQQTVYFIDARYFAMAKDKCNQKGVTPLLYKGLDSIKDYFKSNGIKRAYINFDKTSLTEYSAYKKLGVRILDGTKKINTARAIKGEDELNLIARANEITFTAFQTAISSLKVGITEREVAAIIKAKMLELGAEDTSFETIVAFGKNSAVPHHETGDEKLTKDTVVLIDTGAKYKGYSADLTRTVFFGTPTERFIYCYNAVLRANLVAEEIITDGTSAVKADAYARDLLKEYPFNAACDEGKDDKTLADYFTHSLGHGIGLDVHEYPTLSPKGDATLKNGMVFSVEPGVYIEGEFGIRIEDSVTLKNGKVVRFYTDDKKLICIS